MVIQAINLKILLCGDFFWPSIGGSELYLEDIATRLSELGHRVEIACRWQSNRTQQTYKNYFIHQFHCAGNLGSGITGDLAAYRSLVFENGFDCVFILTHPDNWNFAALRDPPDIRPRIVAMPSINAVNLEEWNRNDSISDVCKILRVPDLLIRASELGCDAKFFARMGLGSVFIPHAVEPKPNELEFRRHFNLSIDKPLLVMLANFWPVKNHDGLLKILRNVPGNWQILMIGHKVPFSKEKRYFKSVMRLSMQDDRVRIINGLPRDLSLSAIRDADLLLLPSKGESAGPLVVLEAMSLGTPWLATPNCNAVYDQAGGVVLPLSKFPQAIQTMLLKPDLLVKLGRLGKQDWANRFVWDKVIAAYAVSLTENNFEKFDFSMPLATRDENSILIKSFDGPLCGGQKIKPIISVVIPTFNRHTVLLKCLEALNSQTISPDDFEVIVCDDGSTDDTYKALQQFEARYPLRYFRQENVGQAVARNKAILESSADLILILNDDAILEPDALRIHLEEHSTRSNEKIAVLGHFRLHPEYNNLNGPFAHALDNSDLIFEYKFMVSNNGHKHNYFYTCNISIRKEYLLGVGLFDEAFGTAGAEDIEIGYRLCRGGLSIIYRPDCIAWHAHTLGVDGLAKMFMTRGKGGVLLFFRHPTLPHHYRGLTLCRAQEIQKRHQQMNPLILKLCAVLKKFDAMSFSLPRSQIVLSERHKKIHFKYLWAAGAEDLCICIQELTKNILENIKRIEYNNRPMQLDEAAIMVYPALSLIKWYYDTLGITQSNYLDQLIKLQSKMKLSIYLSKYKNHYLKITKGKYYLCPNVLKY